MRVSALPRLPLLTLGLLAALAACKPIDPDANGAKNPKAGAGEATVAADGPLKPGSGEATIEASARKLFGGQTPMLVRASPIDGLQEVFVAGDVFYASPDGRYFLRGDMVDVQTMQSKTEEARAVPRAEAMKEIDAKDAITFPAKGKEAFEIYAFTDTDCGYCRKMHDEIADYNRRGITVHYLPWPRSGAQGPTYDTMVSVWCAKDKNKALTDAKAGKAVPKATCENPVAKYVELGRRMMVNGTPAIFTPDARQLGGYVPAADLEQRLKGTPAK